MAFEDLGEFYQSPGEYAVMSKKGWHALLCFRPAMLLRKSRTEVK